MPLVSVRKLRIKLKHLWIIILGLVIVIAGIAVLWLNQTWVPTQDAYRAFVSDAQVTVSNTEFLSFRPMKSIKSIGILIYPGGKVHPLAYANIARSLAEQGYLSVIVPMPFNLAILDAYKGEEVMRQNPEVTDWIVIGHSLGGVAASRLADDNPNISGLVLLASTIYPGVDMSTQQVMVTLVIGSLDGLITLDEIEQVLEYIPDNSRLQIIEGGNHSYFGDYGIQSGDNLATITWDEQQFVVIQEILLQARQLELE